VGRLHFGAKVGKMTARRRPLCARTRRAQGGEGDQQQAAQPNDERDAA